MIELISLELIEDNPYQPRMVDDPEHIEKLARSIAADDLLQTPKARRCSDGTYQLAFGHSRRRAFEWLRDFEGAIEPNRYDGYSMMPLEIVDLTDEEMYRHAVTENVQRKDLNPIEMAKAMVRYRDEFGKNSDEIGELFGMSGSTVRGKLRLLDLPDMVQEKLVSGQISEGAARLAISVSRLAPDRLDQYVSDVTDGDQPDDAARYAMQASKKTKAIHESDFAVAQKSFKHLPELTGYVVAESLDQPALKLREDLFLTSVEMMSQKHAIPSGEYEERVLHLLKPPACTACPFFAVVDNVNWCGLRACYDRKEAAHARATVIRESEKSGIAVYDETVDGPSINLSSWDDDDVELVKKRHADLRLKAEGTYHNFPGLSSDVTVVIVGDLYKKAQAEKVERALANGREPELKTENPEEARKQKISVIHYRVAEQLQPRLEFELAGYFESLLENVKHVNFLRQLYSNMDYHSEYFDEEVDEGDKFDELSKANQLKSLRQAIIGGMLYDAETYAERNKVRQARKPASEYAKFLRKQAEEWGVKLGKDFDSTIERMDAEIAEARRVAVETEFPTAPKKGKK